MSKTKEYKKRYYLPNQEDYTVEQFPGGGSTISQDLSVFGLTTSSVTVGDNLPNWMRLIRLGENATTSMTATVQRVQPLRWGRVAADWRYVPDFPSDNWYRRYGSIRGLFVGSPILSPSNPALISSQKAEDLALARFNAQVAEVNRQFQGGVFLAELGKTLHGLRNPAEALFKGIERYFHAAKKLRSRTIRKYLKVKNLGEITGPIDLRSLGKRQNRLLRKEFTKAATGLWLEQSFHWLPLMYDIQGAWSALRHSYERLPSQFVKASATDVQAEASEFAQTGISWILADITVKQTTSASVRMYGRVRVGTRVPSWPDNKALGYDIRSFVPTLWELLPYSWAVDYFTNIGDVIYGLSYGGQDVLWCARGIKRVIARRHFGTSAVKPQLPPNLHHNTAFTVIAATSEVLAEKAILSRATYTGSYIPLFEWRVPKLTSLKWLNLGAAWLQRIH